MSANVLWRSSKLAIRSHLSAIWRHIVLFSGSRVNFAMNSHSAANLRNRSDVFITTSALCRTLGQKTLISLKGSGSKQMNVFSFPRLRHVGAPDAKPAQQPPLFPYEIRDVAVACPNGTLIHPDHYLISKNIGVDGIAA